MLVGGKFIGWRCKVGTIALNASASKPGFLAKLSIAAGKFGKNPVSGVGVRKSSVD